VPRYLNETAGPGGVYGDLELYNYDPTQAFNISGYRVGRYVNEFGYHAMSSIYSLDAVLTNKEAFDFNSTENRVHDKHSPAGSLEYPFPADDGQYQMSAPVELYWGKPIDKEDPRDTLAAWAYATQIHSAAMISNEILFYRLGSGRPERNLGGVYWQLADNWQGSTWASIGECLESIMLKALLEEATLTSLRFLSPQNTEVDGKSCITWHLELRTESYRSLFGTLEIRLSSYTPS